MTKINVTDAFGLRGIHRRNFIKTIGVGAAGAAVMGTGVSSLGLVVAQAQTSPTLSKYTEQLPVPPVVNAKGGGSFSLPMAPGLQRFHSALPLTPAWGYAGMSYLGPTFEVKRGVPITVTARNNLDAHPESTFLPGRRFDYHYVNNQEATTLWYHDHALGITRLNVHAGLAGMYLVRDSRDTGLGGNPIGLPSGSFELPLT